jgi:hypothetical protein
MKHHHALAAIVLVMASAGHCAELSISHGPCDAELLAETARFDREMAAVRDDWRRKVHARMEGAKLTPAQQQEAEESLVLSFNAFANRLTTLLAAPAALKALLLLPTYPPETCDQMDAIREGIDMSVVGYRSALDGWLEESGVQVLKTPR